MRAFIASPLGFLIGLSLGALGGGGSILAVPALVYGAGQDPKEATTTSLLLVGVAALVGMRTHLAAGRVRVGVGVAFGVAGIGGSLAGTALNHRLDPDMLLLGFSGLVIVAAWRMVTACPTCTRTGEVTALSGASPPVSGAAPPDAIRVVAGLVAAGTGVGFLTGLFGVGGGFVIVPALTLVLHLAMPEAIGTSLLVITINAAVAFAPRAGSATIDWGVALPFVVAAVAGVVSGGAVADRLDARRSLRWFATLLVGVAFATAGRAVAGLT